MTAALREPGLIAGFLKRFIREGAGQALGPSDVPRAPYGFPSGGSFKGDIGGILAVSWGFKGI